MVRFIDSGDESDVATGAGLAPVTPLFGDRGGTGFPKTAAEVRRALGGLGIESGPPLPDERPFDIASVRSDRTASPGRSRPRDRLDSVADAGEAAEQGLLKKLRARQLSVSEAKSYLGTHELEPESVDAILGAFLARGYLDDARLAEQVVHSGVGRKGQGRKVVAQSLAKRGVPRDVADAALAELPDDDAERALEFARTKAGSMRSLERDVALRRLAGQLARRGYGGSVALNAARTALDEASRPSGGVRFR